MYNLASIYLDEGQPFTFSFNKAYEIMKPAAEHGHTLSAYSVAMMHYMAVGTYESC